MSSLGKRRESDAMTLMMRDFIVELIDDRTDEFIVILRGPTGSPYKGGVWKLHVQLPDAYPYKPPSITFMNKIFHPNIHEHLGTICLNVIDKDWSPAYEFVKVFDIILPQLLLYPNPSHGLNEDAIFLLMTNKEEFEEKVKEYCVLYAKEEDIIGSSSRAEILDGDFSDSEDASSDDNSEDAVAGVLEL
ncbi:ubiquitin-conjugating enzyme E2 5-like [Silene latifolia]|uniref:ubiquitin-conjugating enzyme E2 5-like n=1 Tax=Silene latifolia TaxID=37657 RepID=UPI003D772A9E